ncbi:MAG: sigma-70 family RNA polymerase sigma factor [Aldersonia sp.]|nr:sigma-70 family RNA polymerase sigma factor [Aldersonia sp.]
MSELLDRCRDGDHAAFAALITPYRADAWTIARQILDDRVDAENAIQSALVATWQNLPKFQGEARFRTWFCRIVINASFDILRRRASGAPTDLVDPTDVPEISATAPPAAHRVVDADAIRSALAALPEDLREAVVLREFGDLSYAEIAEHQGIGVLPVRSRVSRARAQLVETLKPA